MFARLYMCFVVDKDENELEILVLIHNYVLALDEYFTVIFLLFELKLFVYHFIPELSQFLLLSILL